MDDESKGHKDVEAQEHGDVTSFFLLLYLDSYVSRTLRWPATATPTAQTILTTRIVTVMQVTFLSRGIWANMFFQRSSGPSKDGPGGKAKAQEEVKSLFIANPVSI
jgi:hypothetical protein